MAAKRTEATPTAEDDLVSSLFDGISDVKKGPTAKKSATKAIADEDILAGLEELTHSRPHTPRVKDGARASAANRRSEDRQAAAAAASAADRKSTDSARSLRASFTPSATSSELQDSEKRVPVSTAAEGQEQDAGGGGWWGSIFTQASAVVKTAEAAVKDLQQHEEAKKWADHVRGNVGVIRGFGKS